MLISIIIPIFNVAPYVERCLISVMNQTYIGSLECLIVDDCGTDSSMDIVGRLVAEYKGSVKFNIIPHDHNRGLSAARNTGIDAANGDYVFFLDSDDELMLDCIETLSRPIQNNPDIEIVMGNYCRFHSNNPSSPEKWKAFYNEESIASNKTVRDLFFIQKMYFISAWNKLIKKDFLVSNHLYFKESLLHEDWLWTHYVLQCLNYLYIVPDITYYYYKHPNSITTGMSKSDRAYNFGIVYEEIANSFTPGEEAREAIYYMRGFCSLFCENPKLPSFQRTTRLIKYVLSDGHHTTEWTILSVLIFLSKHIVGRWILSITVYLKKRIRLLMLI